jgi:hypothetical protein
VTVAAEKGVDQLLATADKPHPIHEVHLVGVLNLHRKNGEEVQCAPVTISTNVGIIEEAPVVVRVCLRHPSGRDIVNTPATVKAEIGRSARRKCLPHQSDRSPVSPVGQSLLQNPTSQVLKGNQLRLRVCPRHPSGRDIATNPATVTVEAEIRRSNKPVRRSLVGRDLPSNTIRLLLNVQQPVSQSQVVRWNPPDSAIHQSVVGNPPQQQFRVNRFPNLRSKYLRFHLSLDRWLGIHQ